MPKPRNDASTARLVFRRQLGAPFRPEPQSVVGNIRKRVLVRLAEFGRDVIKIALVDESCRGKRQRGDRPPLYFAVEPVDPAVADIRRIGKTGAIDEVGLDVVPVDRKDGGAKREAVMLAVPPPDAQFDLPQFVAQEFLPLLARSGGRDREAGGPEPFLEMAINRKRRSKLPVNRSGRREAHAHPRRFLRFVEPLPDQPPGPAADRKSPTHRQSESTA